MAGGMAPNWENIFNAIGQEAERNIAKPTEFHGKRSKDAEEWLDRFIRIVLANNWTDVRKLQIIPIYGL